MWVYIYFRISLQYFTISNIGFGVPVSLDIWRRVTFLVWMNEFSVKFSWIFGNVTRLDIHSSRSISEWIHTFEFFKPDTLIFLSHVQIYKWYSNTTCMDWTLMTQEWKYQFVKFDLKSPLHQNQAKPSETPFHFHTEVEFITYSS